MLMTNATQRPDLDEILKRPFIQKHIINFFSDIASRPSTAKMGEGTMIVRAAVNGGGVEARGALSNDQNMLNLRQQLRECGLTDAMNAALAPPPTSQPATSGEARKRARDQAGALRREEDNKKMVESTYCTLLFYCSSFFSSFLVCDVSVCLSVCLSVWLAGCLSICLSLIHLLLPACLHSLTWHKF
jgi:hypothetical protein